MNFSKLLISLFFILPNFSYAQTQHWGRTYDDKLPDAFKIEVSELRDQIYNGIPENIRTGVFDRKVFQFSDENAMRISNLIQSGDVYTDWKALEDYVNTVFQKVIPDELKTDKGIHAYIIKEGRYNAFMTPTGLTFIHIGLLSEVKDEAALAAVLAHELAHYHLRHSLNRFLKAEQGEFRAGLFQNKRLASDFSIANETQADSLAVVWLAQSGYDVNGAIDAFKDMEAREKNLLMRIKKWELTATTHPLSEDRLKLMKDYIKKMPEAKGERYLVGKDKFDLFAKEAKTEVLKLLLEDFDYDYCIEQAFRYHIFDVNNPIYVYYAMEAIRRMCYLNPELWQRNFITYRYFDIVNGDDRTERKKVPMANHLFTKLPKDVLRIRSQDASKIQAKFYWQKVKFTTNEQAFEFLYQISQMLKDNESILTYALSVTNSDEMRNKFLKEYIGKEGVKYKEYAENLLKGTLRDNLKPQKLTVFSRFEVRVRQKKSDVLIRETQVGSVNQEAELLKNVVTGFKDRTPLFLSDLKNDRLNDFRALNELEQFSFIQLISKGQEAKLDIFSPNYWQLMKRFGVNEIEFVNSFYLNNTTDKKTLETYKTAIEQDMKSIMMLEKQTKFLQSFVTSVRMIEGGTMKIRYYDGEKKLKVKETGYSQVENWIKIFLKEKDALAFKLDAQYRNQ